MWHSSATVCDRGLVQTLLLKRLISSNKKRTLGGQDASLREYPHMAAIGDNSIEMEDEENFIVWFCAGSLISESG